MPQLNLEAVATTQTKQPHKYMSRFERCDTSVNEMAAGLLLKYESHKPLVNAKVTIDYVFAFAEQDDEGHLLGDALKHHGVKALGITRKIPTKERALGRGDAEISLDGDWWKDASEADQKALLDHELHHFAVKIDKRGLMRDDLGRPVITMRNHDYDFGWFKIIAERHGENSQEVQGAMTMFNDAGQLFWPSIAGK